MLHRKFVQSAQFADARRLQSVRRQSVAFVRATDNLQKLSLRRCCESKALFQAIESNGASVDVTEIDLRCGPEPDSDVYCVALSVATLMASPRDEEHFFDLVIAWETPPATILGLVEDSDALTPVMYCSQRLTSARRGAMRDADAGVTSLSASEGPNVADPAMLAMELLEEASMPRAFRLVVGGWNQPSALAVRVREKCFLFRAPGVRNSYEKDARRRDDYFSNYALAAAIAFTTGSWNLEDVDCCRHAMQVARFVAAARLVTTSAMSYGDIQWAVRNHPEYALNGARGIDYEVQLSGGRRAM
jgi:hypothetical protein